MLVLSRSDVQSLMDIDRLINHLSEAMMHLSSHRATMAPRTTVRIEEHEGLLASMLSYVSPTGWLASKLVSVYPENSRKGIATHQAIVTCFDSETGAPIAVMDGAYITEVRTAAGSAVATRALARPGSQIMAVLGTGVQAGSHARLVSRVVELDEVRIAGRNPDKAQLLALLLDAELDVAVKAAPDFETAMRGAHIVCAATHSPEPVVKREWVEPGMHINSVGVNPAGREVEAEVVRDSLVVVESLDAALASPEAAGANDLVWPIRDGLISVNHVNSEIGQILRGDARGRSSDTDITLYKSVGVSVQDAAAAGLILEAARAGGVGTEVEL